MLFFFFFVAGGGIEKNLAIGQQGELFEEWLEL
jgi:hypothetical protein